MSQHDRRIATAATILSFVALVSACSAAREIPVDYRGTRTTFEVKVLRFAAYSSIDHFQKGRFEAHHTTEFQIISPAQYSGKTLRVFHSKLPVEGSVWRAVGATLRLVVAAEPFDGQWHIFRGAVVGVTRLK